MILYFQNTELLKFGILPNRFLLYFVWLKFARQVMWSKFEITPVLKFSKLPTWNFNYMFLVVLRRNTKTIKSTTNIILALGYFKFLVTCLAQQISNVRTIVGCLFTCNWCEQFDNNESIFRSVYFHFFLLNINADITNFYVFWVRSTF